MTVRRSLAARWGLLGFTLLALGLEAGCSEFRARRRIGRSPVTTAPAATVPAPAVGVDVPVTEGEIITTPAGTPTYGSPSLGRSSRRATPAAVGEPALDPEPLPTIGAGPTPSRTDSLRTSGGVVPASASSVTLRAPVPAEAASTSGPVLEPPITTPAAASSRLAGSIQADRRAIEPTNLGTASAVVVESRAALDALASYQLDLHRQERVGGTLLPAEDLVMSIRRFPRATRLTWVDGSHKGREVLYRADEPGGQMHVHMGDSKFPMPRMSLSPTSPLVMKNSRHPITEAGLDPLIAGLEAADRDGTLADLGMQAPAPLDRPHRGLTRRTAEGETWRVYLDPSSHLPALVDCRAANGEVLEFYHFRNIRPDPPELASAEAFDPDARWGAPRGLFGRVATRNEAQAPTATR